ncbi:hypothetical protein ASE01_19865 [Nocardioides sp. Root190]|uniref:hypothetical protein n=1 Tax=Nocardioides sp. Root190 TaxID=1736488 RepID=UPI0006F51078|nr:hypothetical protein [Nocardioides sp. Root190]KRB73035.1 hypothetical protein ASE01_19865 [Nocardioides sp. Root190]
MSISGSHRVLAGTVVLVVVACLLVTWAALQDRPTPPSRTTPAAPVAVVAPGAGDVGTARAVSSLVVLRDWDRARAGAWEHGDVRALRRLYVRGSEAGARDVAMLRRWTERGLRVRGMAMQVVALTLHERTGRRLVLVVTDRLVGAVAIGDGREVSLPRDGETTRRLSFRKVGGRWVLAAVQEVARPVASTASTSRSAKE